MLNKNFVRLLLLATSILPIAVESRTFQSEGSDLLLGVGAEQMAIAGAAVASTNDVYSIFWNPAGLSEINKTQFSVSKQLNSTLSPINFIGLTIVSDKLNFFGLKSTISAAWIPRLHIGATGAYKKEDLESIFIRFALPDMPSDFDGEVETKTKDFRFSWAITPQYNAKWSFALSLSRIDCRSFFCGVSADDPGNYTASTASATAYSGHFGVKYYFSDNLTFGLNVEDIHTVLDVRVISTDKTGTEDNIFSAALPRDITFGVVWRQSSILHLSFDYEQISGKYSNYDIDIKILRGGISYYGDWLNYRSGIILPLVINSDNVGNIKDKLPFHFAPTAGVGWQNKHWKLDFVMYAHLLMSHHHRRPYPAADLSISYKF